MDTRAGADQNLRVETLASLPSQSPMKILKYSLIGTGGLLVLAIVAVAVFAMTFDPNRYKGQIEALVKEKTGRTLKLQGDLKVAIFPSLGADVAKVTLSERAAGEEFLS